MLADSGRVRGDIESPHHSPITTHRHMLPRVLRDQKISGVGEGSGPVDGTRLVLADYVLRKAPES